MFKRMNIFRNYCFKCLMDVRGGAQVAHDASSGDFDLGDPSELRQLLPAVEGAAGGGPPPSPISAPVPMSLSMQHHPAAPATAAPSASLAPPVPAVQVCRRHCRRTHAEMHVRCADLR